MRIRIVPLVAIFALLLTVISACERQEAKKPGNRKVSICVAQVVFSTPVIIALEKGFFDREGLDVNVREYPFGKLALEAMLAGDGDMAIVADLPIVFNSFKRDDFIVLSTFTHNYNDSRMVARKDSGINKPADLKGKKIGTTFGTSTQFFLNIFLSYDGLTETDIIRVNLPQYDLLAEIESGKVDAIAVFDPYAYKAIQMLGDQAVGFPQTGMYRETFNLAANKSFAEKEPETLKKILRGIDRAVTFIKENRRESISIIANKLKLDDKYLNETWDNYVFGLSLDQSLITTFEDEARWAIKNGLTDKKEIPNYLNFIYQDTLQQVKPEAMRIIR
jgi:NitT/TauT family transport system substrate-binding protein